MSKLTLEERRAVTEKARQTFHHRGGYSSGLETKVQEVLIDLGENFEHNVTKFGYNWDIVIEDKLLIIEVQGQLFHADPEIYDETFSIRGWFTAKEIWDKDKRKKEVAEKNGYSVIYVWEKEIRGKSAKELKALLSKKIKS